MATEEPKNEPKVTKTRMPGWMVSVQAEYKYWDPARVGTDTTRRVPDAVCTHPHTQVEYVLDARIFWDSMIAGPGGYISYDHTGWGAEQVYDCDDCNCTIVAPELWANLHSRLGSN